MIKKQLILKDPLKFININEEHEPAAGGFGAVIARPGIGKTAFLVQIALRAMLADKKVLHISVQDPVDKVNLWYIELFQKITSPFKSEQQAGLWEELLTQRFIMTFETESFSFEKLENRISELKAQNVFVPDMVIIDGLAFDAAMYPKLSRLKLFTGANDMKVWFAVGRYTREASDVLDVADEFGDDFTALFDSILWMVPEKTRILVKQYANRPTDVEDRPLVCLDPSTMLVQEEFCAESPE
jgi:hypothetical protein